jgi:hypothetical protein
LVAVVSDHLAVEHELPGRLRRNGFADLGIRAGEVLARARLQPHISTVLESDAPLAVKFPLQQPVVVEITTVSQCSQHQRGRHSIPLSGRQPGQRERKAWTVIMSFGRLDPTSQRPVAKSRRDRRSTSHDA